MATVDHAPELTTKRTPLLALWQRREHEQMPCVHGQRDLPTWTRCMFISRLRANHTQKTSFGQKFSCMGQWAHLAYTRGKGFLPEVFSPSTSFPLSVSAHKVALFFGSSFLCEKDHICRKSATVRYFPSAAAVVCG